MLFSFFTIASLPREEYREQFYSVNDEDMLHAMEDQTHLSAVVARGKFSWLSHAWWFLDGAIMSAMIFIILSLFV